MYSETWHKLYCPKCEAVNWINNGDISDMTVLDVEGCECRICGHVWLFDDEEYGEDADIEKILEGDYHNIEKGLEIPE